MVTDLGRVVERCSGCDKHLVCPVVIAQTHRTHHQEEHEHLRERRSKCNGGDDHVRHVSGVDGDCKIGRVDHKGAGKDAVNYETHHPEKGCIRAAC